MPCEPCRRRDNGRGAPASHDHIMAHLKYPVNSVWARFATDPAGGLWYAASSERARMHLSAAMF